MERECFESLTSIFDFGGGGGGEVKKKTRGGPRNRRWPAPNL